MATRRKFLKDSAKKALSIASGCAALRAGRSLGAASNHPFILQIYCAGGWDPSVVFDPKIGVATLPKETGSRQITAGASLVYAKNSARPSVDAYFRDFADKSAIVNGISCLSMNHDNATRRVLGYLDTQSGRTVDWLTYYAYMVEPFATFPHVVFDAPLVAGPLGQYVYRLNAKAIEELAAVNSSSIGTSSRAQISAYLKGRYGALSDQYRSASLDSEKIDALYRGFLRNSTAPAAMRSAALSVAASAPKAQGFGKNGMMAIELFKARKARCATVQMGNGTLWDTHTDNFSLQSANFETLFAGLNDIMAYAKSAGISEKLLVVVTSELGRSPYLNDQLGKDHWPFTSALVTGPGIASGVTVGLTDDFLRGQKINPIFGGKGDTLISMSHVWAAIFLRYGVPYEALMKPEVLPLASIIKS
jgi:Protein of unknown function (DUF1501)